MSQIQLSKFNQKIKIDLVKMNQWPAIKQIFQALNEKNRLCWISGGAVRDIILSRIPLDFDLTTDATDEEILQLFPQAILVGQKFGVYKIPLNGEIYDLTVFREEDEYVDGRRPVAIRRSTPEKDAQRRDFTMNALFWDLKNEILVDYVDGLKDLEARVVRCVGLPSKRFGEDYLRVLRMIRLSYALGFEMDHESYQAGLGCAPLLVGISGERILAEILKLTDMNLRLKFYSDLIFIEIMKHNDFNLVDTNVKVNQLKETKLVDGLFIRDRILIELLFLLGFDLDFALKIQSRLKIGNDAKKWLFKSVELNSLIDQKSDFISYCLLIDKSPDFLVLINYFKALGLIEEKLFLQIINTHQKFPILLIQARDIIHLVPPQDISKVLVRARAWQLKNEITDLNLMLDFVKNKELGKS